MRSLKRYFFLSVLAVSISGAVMGCEAERREAASEKTQEPRHQLETTAEILPRSASDYVPVSTLSWDHEQNAEHGWTYFSAEPQFNSLYMGVHCITDQTSPQWNWLQTHFWDYDEEGICVYEGRTLVALTPEFGDVGDYVDLLLADGTVLETIICDIKADSETYGHRHDDWINVLEIIVSPEWYEENHENKYYPDVIAYRRNLRE